MYRTAERRNRLTVGDLWALWGAEGHVAFLTQSCRPQSWGRESSQNSLPQKWGLQRKLSGSLVWLSNQVMLELRHSSHFCSKKSLYGIIIIKKNFKSVARLIKCAHHIILQHCSDRKMYNNMCNLLINVSLNSLREKGGAQSYTFPTSTPSGSSLSKYNTCNAIN